MRTLQAIYFIQSAQVIAMGTFPPGYLDFLLEAVGEEIEAEFGFPPGQCMDETFLVLPSLAESRVNHHIEQSFVEGLEL